jgi:hypothetical protein
MFPFKSGQTGRLPGGCALWTLRRIEGVSRVYIGCVHDTIDRTRQQFSGDIRSRSLGRADRLANQQFKHCSQVLKLWHIVSLRDALEQYAEILEDMLVAWERASSRTLFFRCRVTKLAMGHWRLSDRPPSTNT